MLGLRLNEGFNLNRLNNEIDKVKLKKFIENKYIEKRDNYIKCYLKKGRVVSNYIIKELLIEG